MADVTRPHPILPVIQSGEINWDLVAGQYQQYVLSPFHPEMLEAGRNPLVTEVRRQVAAAQGQGRVQIADFGCGPGSLLPSLVGLDVAVTGLDLSRGSLGVAQGAASWAGVDFTGICADLTTVELDQRFEMVVCSNSVLPADRADVVPILSRVAHHLSDTGRAYFILPSFDTTEHLVQLHREAALARGSSLAAADGLVAQLSRAKKMDPVLLKYADDGYSAQCYHTPDSIAAEFAEAGLAVVAGPRKVYYPWDLTRRFDYGYFLGADEEIWDWYVVAQRI